MTVETGPEEEKTDLDAEGRAPAFSGYWSKLLFGMALGAVVFIGFSVYTDFDKLLDAFGLFNWWYFLILLVLSFLNYVFRFFKWDYYLRELGISIRKRSSAAVFFSGLVMTVTPGKMGELLKSFLLKQVNGTAISKSAPVIVAERLSDFVALIILSCLGISIYALRNELFVLIITAALTVAFLALIAWRGLSLWMIGLLEHIRPMQKLMGRVRTAYESIYALIAPRRLAWATFLSLLAWFCECFGLYLVLWYFKADSPLLMVVFIYSISTIAGAITMLPGGLGATEISMSALIIKLTALAKANAVAATFIIRLATLWFAVLVGAVVLLTQRRLLVADSEAVSETGGQ